MSGSTVVHIGENSPEQVALKLLEKIADVEKKVFYTSGVDSGYEAPNRKWILDTYTECLRAVKGQRTLGRVDDVGF